jgi:hypothetical protein
MTKWDQANLSADYFLFLKRQLDPFKGISLIQFEFHWIATSISRRMGKAVEFYNSLVPVLLMSLDLCTHCLRAYD